ncbi:MAG TPA: c-type cytochrome [Candidatus Acidoferrales bacterium]|nr:c-type cytochrome [Candidatus Acidoferrales bacterium]
MSHPLNFRALAVGLVALAIAGGVATAFSADAGGPAKGDPAKGKAIFNVKCIACHKTDGSGGVKLTGNPTPNWKDPKTWADPKRKAGDAYLRDCITNGKLPSGMIAWGKTGQLKPADISNVIAYIHVLAGRK